MIAFILRIVSAFFISGIVFKIFNDILNYFSFLNFFNSIEYGFAVVFAPLISEFTAVTFSAIITYFITFTFSYFIYKFLLK